MNEIQVAAEIARLLSDPLRLTVLQFLAWGPCSVAQLVEVTGSTQPNVSNHLKLLRENNIVTAEKSGRQTIYSIASSAIAELVAALSWAATGATSATTLPTPASLQEGRTCYDHLAGKTGVGLMKGLRKAGAIDEACESWDSIELGPSAGNVFQLLGFDLDKALKDGTRRRFAFACPDWSEHGQSHLGGLLGAALCAHCLNSGWIERDRVTRAIIVTASGSAALGWLIATDKPFVASIRIKGM